MKKLSHSACNKWLQCPFSFDAYYNQRLEPIKKGSALMFGSGMDAGLNALLSTLMPMSVQLKSPADPLAAYKDAVAGYELGSITYSKYDFDVELLDQAALDGLLPKLKTHGYNGTDPIGLYEALKTKQANNETLSANQEKALCLIYRAVFEVKAALMFEAYKEKVLPRILKVISVQKNSGPGVLDAIVEWDGYGVIIADNKTAGRAYPDDAVEFSGQLAMYAAEENINRAAFIVLLKEITKNRKKICSVCGHDGTGKRHKTCDKEITTGTPKNADGTKRCNGEWTETILPKAEIQIVHGEITPEMLAVAAEAQREIQRAVAEKIFPCNIGKCNDQYGKPCEYKNYKWKNDMTGLKKRDSK